MEIYRPRHLARRQSERRTLARRIKTPILSISTEKITPTTFIAGSPKAFTELTAYTSLFLLDKSSWGGGNVYETISALPEEFWVYRTHARDTVEGWKII